MEVFSRLMNHSKAHHVATRALSSKRIPRIPRITYYPGIKFPDDPGNSSLDGMEGEILMELKHGLNFTIKVVVLENEADKWGKFMFLYIYLKPE